MACCSGGDNKFRAFPAPSGANGFVSEVDVSDLVGRKDLYVHGTWSGEYIILGEQIDGELVPIHRISNQGDLIRQRITLTGSYLNWHLFKNASADNEPVFNIAAPETCACA
jgi:hypothetical protein